MQHEVSSRHDWRRLCISRTIRWRIYKKDLTDLNVQPQGNIFLTWSSDHSVTSVLMTDSTPLYSHQAASTPLPCKCTASPLLPFKQPASPPLLYNWADSLFLRAKFPSSSSPYGNQPFPHRFCKKFQCTCPEAGFTSNPNELHPS